MNLDGMSIEQIEETADALQVKFNEVMAYLEKTKRFRNNPDYSRWAFVDYIKSRFNVPYHKFAQQFYQET